jgi:hypothetical protein
MPTNINGTTGVDKVQDGVVSATSIPNGELPIAKLATTGTASSSTYLRGDGSWQTIETTPTTDQVLAATADLTVGAVGSYAFLTSTSSTLDNRTEGFTVSGSILRYSSAAAVQGGTPSGTWRLLGATGTSNASKSTLFLRIS